MKIVSVICLAGAIGVSLVEISRAVSQTTVPPDAAAIIKTRQAAMTSNGDSTKAIKDELAKGMPSIDVIRRSTAGLKAVQPQIVSFFPAGTGSEAGVKTDALPTIWQKPDEFVGAHQAYSAELARFAALVDTGDVAAIETEFPVLTKSCDGCHKKFSK